MNPQGLIDAAIFSVPVIILSVCAWVGLARERNRPRYRRKGRTVFHVFHNGDRVAVTSTIGEARAVVSARPFHIRRNLEIWREVNQSWRRVR